MEFVNLSEAATGGAEPGDHTLEATVVFDPSGAGSRRFGSQVDADGSAAAIVGPSAVGAAGSIGGVGEIPSLRTEQSLVLEGQSRGRGAREIEIAQSIAKCLKAHVSSYRRASDPQIGPILIFSTPRLGIRTAVGASTCWPRSRSGRWSRAS